MKIKIRIKMFIYIYTAIIAVFFVMAGMIYINLLRVSEAQIIKNSETISNKYMQIIKSDILSEYDKMQIVSDNMEYLIKDKKIDKNYISSFLREIAIKGNNLFGVWAVFEPEYFSENNKRFAPYWNKESGIHYEECVDYESSNEKGNYYNIPKKTLRPYITDPVSYNINSKEVQLVSICMPMIIDKKFIGVLGCDFSIKEVSGMILDAKPFEKSFTALITPKFKYFSHPDKSAVDVSIFQADKKIYNDSTETYNKIVENLEKNKPFTVERINLNKEKILGLYFPIQIFRNTNNWYFYVDVSKESLMKDNEKIMNILFLGLTGILVIIGIILVFISGSISKPIKLISEKIKKFSSGYQDVSFKVKSNDEISEMSEFLEKMTKDLVSSNEELTNMNEELEHSYNEINLLSQKMSLVIDLTTDLISRHSTDFQTFFDYLLKYALDIIDEADYGNVSLIDGDDWLFVSVCGYDKDRLNSLGLKSSYMTLSDNVTIVDKLSDYEREYMPHETAEVLLDAVNKVRSSMFVSLKVDDEIIGNIGLDIDKNNPKNFQPESARVLKSLSNIASAYITIKKYNDMKDGFQKNIILSMIKILEMYDSYTKGHSTNVAELSVKIAKKMNMNKSEIEKIYWAGLVHDIGKILISNTILNKPDKLTEAEFSEIKKHPVYGYEMLSSSSELYDIAKIIRHHHERFDGKGYPDGKKGEEIPLFSRIIMIADTYDAMTSSRSYRKALPKEAAFYELMENSGTQFDPDIVKIFIEIMKDDDI